MSLITALNIFEEEQIVRRIKKNATSSCDAEIKGNHTLLIKLIDPLKLNQSSYNALKLGTFQSCGNVKTRNK